MQTRTEVPPSVTPYVEALGPEGAETFLLGFGGSQIYIPSNPRPASPLVKEIGLEPTQAMRRVFGQGQLKVPLAKPWLARRLDAAGVARPEIAKRLHVTRESVRSYLAIPKGRTRA